LTLHREIPGRRGGGGGAHRRRSRARPGRIPRGPTPISAPPGLPLLRSRSGR